MAPGSRYSLRSTAVLLGLAVLAAGCGDDKVIAVGGGALPDATPPASDAVDTSAPDAPVGPDTDEPTGVLREIILLHDTAAPAQLAITQQLLIRAKVIDYVANAPAANALVTYSIVEQDAPAGDASLTTSQATTDANGEVGVTFRAGFVPDVHYKVRLAANGAEPVFMELLVTDRPKGDIRVKLVYEGPINVKNVNVRLFPGGYTCGQFNPINVPDNAISESTLLGLGLDNEVVWTELPEGEKYTAVATAQSPKGSLAAAGCVDGILVVPEQENVVTMTMYLLTLNPAGTYDTTNVFDFTGAIPGQLGQLVDQIVLLFNDPGKFLINQVKALVASYIGQLVTDIAFSLFEDALADIITDWMLNKSPDWIQDIFTIGQDLTQIVNNLEMMAELKISKLSNAYYIQGLLNWKGIVLYWHYGCAKPGEPGYDPDCGKLVLSIDAFSNTQFPQDIIQGKFTGSIADFDQLDVDNHTIKINYGKLIIFVLNEIILPALTGEHTLTDAIISFVNCSAIANTFSNGILDAIGVTEDDIEGFCEDGITFIVKPVEIVIGNLALDSQLRLQGHAVLVDDDSNLYVDHIIEGVWLGHVEVDGQAGPTFDGYWDAHRLDF